MRSLPSSPNSLERHHQDLGRAERATRGQDATEAAAAQILGDKVGLTVDTPVVDVDDVGAAQRRHGLGLGPELPDEHRIVRSSRVEHLDRHTTAEADIVGQVDGPGSAGSDRLTQAIAAVEEPADLATGGLTGF